MTIARMRARTHVMAPSQPRLSRYCLVATFALGIAGCSSDPLAIRTCDAELNGACWTHLGLGGDEVRSLVLTKSSLYAGAWAGGVLRYRPEEGGWFSVGPRLPQVMAMLYVPGNPPRLLAALYRSGPTGEASLYATEDEETWVPSDQGLNPPGVYRSVQSLASDPFDPMRLYMGTDFPVLRSDNGGRDWHYVWGSSDTFGHGVFSVVASPHARGRLWVALEDGAEGEALLRSEDGGESWRYVTPPLRSPYAAVTSVAEDPRQPNRIWAATGSGVFLSDHAGSAWTPVFPEFVNHIAFVGERVFAAGFTVSGITDTRLRLFVGTLEGTNWEELQVPEGVPRVGAMIGDDRGRLIVGTWGDGVWVVNFR